MARVTVEDCVLKVPNRFDLVMLAAQRSRDIAAGGALTIERDNDKNPVVALREIADSTVDLDQLGLHLVKSLQKVHEADEPVEEEGGFAAGTTELLSDLVVEDAEGEKPEDDGDTDEDLGEEVDNSAAVGDGEGSDEGANEA